MLNLQFQILQNEFSWKHRKKIEKIFGKLQKINSWPIIKAYSILSHAEWSVRSRTSKTVRTCYCDLTAIIYLIPAGRLIPLVVTSFPVLSFHNLLNFQKTILAHPTLSCSRTPLPNWNRSHPNLNERTTVRTGANRWEQRTNLNMTKCSKSSLEICLKQIFAWSLHKFIIVTWIYAHWIWISAKNSRKFIFSRYLEKKLSLAMIYKWPNSFKSSKVMFWLLEHLNIEYF